MPLTTSTSSASTCTSWKQFPDGPTYTNRFYRCEQSLEAIGINIKATYDDEARGSRLLDKAKLTIEQQRLVLVSTSQRLDYTLVRDALLLQYPEHKPTPPINSFYQDRSKGGGKGGKDKGKGTFTNSAAAANSAGSKGHGHNNFKKAAYVTEHSGVPETIPEGDEEPEEDVDEDESEEQGRHRQPGHQCPRRRR